MQYTRVIPKVMHTIHTLPHSTRLRGGCYTSNVSERSSPCCCTSNNVSCADSVCRTTEMGDEIASCRIKYWIKDRSLKLKLYAIVGRQKFMNCSGSVWWSNTISLRNFTLFQKVSSRSGYYRREGTLWRDENFYRQHIGGHYCCHLGARHTWPVKW